MKHFNDTQRKLLAALADGQCHNGNKLGSLLQVSRTAIWKQINQLIELGLPILRIPRQGYRLQAPLILLNEDMIRGQLINSEFKYPLHFHLFASLDSTNRFLRDLPSSPTLDICCAETQTAGRGRFGRHWCAPFGNIYCSSRWHFDCDLSHLSGMSLVVSLAILAMLDEVGIRDNLSVKWPNDILWHNKKLCGILIEIIAESNSTADVVIGIGLNVNPQANQQAVIDKPWCSLFDITGHHADRSMLIANLLTHLNQSLNEFISQGFAPFIRKWHQVDYLHGQTITVTNPMGSLRGVANGVNEAGQLILIDERGVTHILSSGDTTLHQSYSE